MCLFSNGSQIIVLCRVVAPVPPRLAIFLASRFRAKT